MMPIAYLDGNRIFDENGNAYAVYVVPSHSYPFQPRFIKQKFIEKIAYAVSNMTDEFYMYLLAKQLSVGQITSKMSSISPHPNWKTHVENAKEELEYSLPFTRLNLLLVKLKANKIFDFLQNGNWKEKASRIMAGAIRGVLDVKEKISREEFSLAMEVLEGTRRQSRDLLSNLSTFHSSIREATQKEVEWYLKKPYFRGLADPKLVMPTLFPHKVFMRAGQTQIRPKRSSILTLTDVMMEETHNRLIIHHSDDQVSHQAFFAALETPKEIDDVDSTGYEWIYDLCEKSEFPIDVALHIKVEQSKVAQHELKKKKTRAENQYKEWDENDQDVPLEVLDVLDSVPTLEMKLRARQSLLHVKAIFAIGSHDETILRDQITTFRERSEELLTLVSSPGDTRKMFQAFYPFAPQELPEMWKITMDPGTFGAGVPFATRSLGDPHGFWLGYLLGTNRPVFMDPRRPPAELNKSGGIAIAGTLGGGKSVLMKAIGYYLFLWGAHGFIFDPKGEYKTFLDIPNIGHEIKAIEFTSESGTAFTPFRLGRSEQESAQAAAGVLELILNPKSSEYRSIVINEAVQRVCNRKNKNWDMDSFEVIISEMRNHEEPEFKQEATIVSHRIKQLRNHPLGRLLFGEDTGRPIFEKRLLIAVVHGLMLPGRETIKNEWSEEERLSVALLYSVVTIGFEQLINKPGLKFILMDEFWYLREFEMGRRLYNRILRLGRSNYVIPVMASQNPTDYEPRDGEEDITGLFSWKFILRLDSINQVESAFRILGMNEDNPEDWLKTFSETYHDGIGLAKDPEGRIGEINIELIDEWLMQYFTSTPTDSAPPKEAVFQ